MPGYKVDFKIFLLNRSELERFICPKCSLLLEDAVQPDCGHCLCRTCAEELLKSSPRCPRKDCGSDLSSEDAPDIQHLPKNGLVTKDIPNLEVVCQYLDKGCDWNGKFADFEDHIMRTCSYASVDSNNSHHNAAASEFPLTLVYPQTSTPAKLSGGFQHNPQMDVHSSTFLEVAQPLSLPSIGYQETDPVSDMSENRDEQLMSLTSQVLQPIGSASDQKLTSEKQEFPAKKMEEDGVKTRDGGYASLPQNTDVDPESARKGMDAHLPLPLELAAQPCPLAPLGCKETGLVSDLNAHISENIGEHIKLLASTVKKMMTSVQKLESEKGIQEMESNDGGYESLSDVEVAYKEVSDPKEAMSLVVGQVLQLGKAIQKLQEKPAEPSEEDKGSSPVPETDVVESNGMLMTLGSVLTKERRDSASQLIDTNEGEVKRLREENVALQNEIAALRNENAKLKELLCAKSAKIDERDSRILLAENNGSFVWKISQFSQRMNDTQSGRYTSIFSLPFYTERYGYKMCLRLYILGDSSGKNSHMSLFFVIMRGECDRILQWPFTHKVTFKLHNQTGARDVIDTFQPDPMSSSFRKPKSDMNVASGYPHFVAHQELKNGGFIVDDTIFIRCIIG